MKKSIQKHNALTDGFLPWSGKAVLPDKLVNALYWKYEDDGVDFKITLPELRDLLGLKSSKDDKEYMMLLNYFKLLYRLEILHLRDVVSNGYLLLFCLGLLFGMMGKTIFILNLMI